MGGNVEKSERYDSAESSSEIYNPAAYAGSGLSSKYSGGDEGESDGCGLWERGHVGFLGLETEDGVTNIPYHNIDGVDQPKGVNGFEINFHGTFSLVDSDGEIKKLEGTFVAKIGGLRLEPVVRQIRLCRRVTIHKSSPVTDQKKSQVDSVKIEVSEPERV
jgi:hypothetical protein